MTKALLILGFLLFVCLNGPLSMAAKKQSKSFHQLQHPFGLGIILGEPTGISAKYYLSRQNALDFALAYSFGNAVGIITDYVWHKRGFFGKSSEFVSQLVAYYGAGGYLEFKSGNTNAGKGKSSNSEVRLAIRVPFGIDWMIPKSQIGLSLELVPGLRFIPGIAVILQGGIAGRYYF